MDDKDKRRGEPILSVYAANHRVAVTEWMDGSRDLPDGDHVLYAAPPEAPESRDDQRWQKARTLPRSWWRDAFNRASTPEELDALIDAEMRRKLP